MTIYFSNGHSEEAILLARGEDRMRVAIPAVEDVLELHDHNGTWVSEHGDAVRIEFAWMKRKPTPALAEQDCVCSDALAARLIRALLGDSKKIRTVEVVTGSKVA